MDRFERGQEHIGSIGAKVRGASGEYGKTRMPYGHKTDGLFQIRDCYLRRAGSEVTVGRHFDDVRGCGARSAELGSDTPSRR